MAVRFETSYRRIWRTNTAPDLVICPSMDPHRSCNYGHECGQIVGTPGPARGHADQAGPTHTKSGIRASRQGGISLQQPTGANRLRDLNAQGAST